MFRSIPVPSHTEYFMQELMLIFLSLQELVFVYQIIIKNKS